jgi:hypothetical protein
MRTAVWPTSIWSFSRRYSWHCYLFLAIFPTHAHQVIVVCTSLRAATYFNLFYGPSLSSVLLIFRYFVRRQNAFADVPEQAFVGLLVQVSNPRPTFADHLPTIASVSDIKPSFTHHNIMILFSAAHQAHAAHTNDVACHNKCFHAGVTTATVFLLRPRGSRRPRRQHTGKQMLQALYDPHLNLSIRKDMCLSSSAMRNVTVVVVNRYHGVCPPQVRF